MSVREFRDRRADELKPEPQRPRSAPNKDPRYDKLPEGIKAEMTEKQFCWLSDAEKEGLVDQYVYPETVED